MEHNNRFRTLADAVNTLQRAGYTDELLLNEHGLQKGGKPLDPADFRIDSFHRFEGPSDPADMSIVYAVSSERLGIKGLLIGAYGASAKGTTLLSFAGIGSETLDFVADRSTVKQGKLTPGTRIPIVAAEELVERMPDYVLLLVWNFADEILRQQDEYRRRGGRFIVPIPAVTVV